MHRREFLTGAAALVTGLATGFPRFGRPALAAAPALSPARRATYRRLVAALGDAPRRRFARAAGAKAFADWYAAQPEAMRAHADAVLDAAAELLPTGRGYASLRDLPGGATPTAAQAHRRAILMAAVALVEGPGAQREPTEALA